MKPKKEIAIWPSFKLETSLIALLKNPLHFILYRLFEDGKKYLTPQYSVDLKENVEMIFFLE